MGPALLFCPADRPERYAKAAERADAVILDLEDAVDPANRAAAREALVRHPLDPATTIVRVNAIGSADLDLDLAALADTAYRTVMVPKASAAVGLDRFGQLAIIALCETAAGVLEAPSIAAHPRVVALMWGAEDLVASLRGTSSRFADGRYRDVARHARSSALIAAGAHGKAAIDTVHLDINDLAGLESEATDAAATGFAAVACIHPSQVPVIRAAYWPDDEAIAFARSLLEAAAGESGVFRFRGRMVDGPVFAHATEVVRRAGR